jgi:hypothetical protein
MPIAVAKAARRSSRQAMRRSSWAPLASQASAWPAIHGAGEAEVEDADAAVVADEDVVGLEVAVDEAGGVGGGEAAAGLAGTRRGSRASCAGGA